MKSTIILVLFFVVLASAKPFLDDLVEPTEEEEENSHKHPYGFPQSLMSISPVNHSIVVDYDAIHSIFTKEEVADRQIVAVSIIGALRKGKSFFMDYCLRFMYANYKSINNINNTLSRKTQWIGLPEDKLKGFSWQGGSERHTTGVIIWSDVFLHEIERPGKSPEKLAIILMDTQGLFDTKTSPADNSRIFALGTLISSIQIFNLNDVVQENQLEYLQMATDYAQVNADISSGDKHKPFQNILFLMRDWVHFEDYAYGYHGGQAYIRDVLSTKKDQSPALKQVRDYIYKSFDTIDCFLMPHPGPAVTSKNYNGSYVLMHENFKTNLIALIEELLGPKNLLKKRILDQIVKGQEYGEYMKTFFEKFQSPETPEIQSVYDMVVERQLANYLTEGLKTYQNVISTKVDYRNSREDFENSLEANHKEGKKIAILWYRQTKKMGTTEHILKFEKQLEKDINMLYKSWKNTTMETFDALQKSQQESVAELERIKKESDANIQAEKRVFDEKIRAKEKSFNDNLDEIRKKADLTQQQKDAEIKRLEHQSEKDKIESEKAFQQLMENQARETEKRKSEYEARLKKELENLKNIRDEKQSLALQQIEESRKMFTEMMMKQIEAANEDKKMMLARWENEDKRNKEEMQLLKDRMDQEAQLRRDEIKQQTQAREQEIQERNNQWRNQMELRKEENLRYEKERAESRKDLLETVAAMKKQMEESKKKAENQPQTRERGIVELIAAPFVGFINGLG